MDFLHTWRTFHFSIVFFTRLCTVLALIIGILSITVAALSLAGQEEEKKPENWERRLEMLRSVPYLDAADEEVGEGQTGVLYWVPEKAQPGYNFYCTKNTGEAFVLDMDGRVVHRWTYSSDAEKTSGSDHAIMMENGDLIVIRKNQELLRIDWNSEVLWRKTMPAHHDVVAVPDGSFYVIIQDIKEYRGVKVWFDSMVHLTSDGQEIDRWATFDHLDELKSALDTSNFLDTILDRWRELPPPSRADSSVAGTVVRPGRISPGHVHTNFAQRESVPKKFVQSDSVRKDLFGEEHIQKSNVQKEHVYDYFHMNTITVIPETPLAKEDARFRPGNLLVCFRSVNQIAMLEKDTYHILWAWGEGELEWPHHPTMLENGHILIFDNGSQRQRSRVVELDPVTGSIVWQYAAQPPEVFYSYTRGSAQRLPNGNTLICESDKGRAFEVTPEGEIVWIWLNPDTISNNRQTVYRMVRYSVEVVEKLL